MDGWGAWSAMHAARACPGPMHEFTHLHACTPQVTRSRPRLVVLAPLLSTTPVWELWERPRRSWRAPPSLTPYRYGDLLKHMNMHAPLKALSIWPDAHIPCTTTCRFWGSLGPTTARTYPVPRPMGSWLSCPARTRSPSRCRCVNRGLGLEWTARHVCNVRGTSPSSLSGLTPPCHACLTHVCDVVFTSVSRCHLQSVTRLVDRRWNWHLQCQRGILHTM